MRCIRLLSIPVCLGLLLLAETGEAVIITSPTTGAPTGFFDSPQVIDFEAPEFSPGDQILSPRTIGNATISPADTDSRLMILKLSDVSASVLALGVTGLVRVTFDSEVQVNRVGFDYDASTPIILEAYDAGDVLIGSGPPGGLIGTGFLGFQSSTPIARVDIHDDAGTFVIDNVSYEAGLSHLPEPSSLIIWSLIAFSFAGIGWWRRRRAV